jgi:hypothetical protein
MPRVLTSNATITCPHGGGGVSVPTPAPRGVTVAGAEILLDGDQGTLTRPVCTNVPPCAGYRLTSMGLNATTVRGRKVMLVSDFVQSFTGFPLTVLETHVVNDKTLPGTPPATGAETPPELGEDDKPTVQVVPPTLPFAKASFASTGQPAMLAFTFLLSSQYPLRWLLFHAGPPKVTVDASNGVPGGVVVAPAGGSWPGSSLTVAVTITGAYLAALAPGAHSFVLTGVNRRGFSAFAEGRVTVT